MNYSPWPDEGAAQFKFRFAVWAQVDPMYNENGARHELSELTKFRLWEFWYPFITTNNRLFHAYLGWKPIFPERDPAFYWREMPRAQMLLALGEPFVQLSVRWGWGRIS